MSRHMRRGLKVVCPVGHVLLRASVSVRGVRWDSVNRSSDRITVTGTVSEAGLMRVSCRCDQYVVDLGKVNAETRERRGGAIDVASVVAESHEGPWIVQAPPIGEA